MFTRAEVDDWDTYAPRAINRVAFCANLVNTATFVLTVYDF